MLKLLLSCLVLGLAYGQATMRFEWAFKDYDNNAAGIGAHRVEDLSGNNLHLDYTYSTTDVAINNFEVTTNNDYGM